MTRQVYSGDPTILATRQDLDMDTCHSSLFWRPTILATRHDLDMDTCHSVYLIITRDCFIFIIY